MKGQNTIPLQRAFAEGEAAWRAKFCSTAAKDVILAEWTLGIANRGVMCVSVCAFGFFFFNFSFFFPLFLFSSSLFLISFSFLAWLLWSSLLLDKDRYNLQLKLALPEFTFLAGIYTRKVSICHRMLAFTVFCHWRFRVNGLYILFSWRNSYEKPFLLPFLRRVVLPSLKKYWKIPYFFNVNLGTFRY